MKKIVCMLAVLTLTLGGVGCTQKDEEPPKGNVEIEQPQKTDEPDVNVKVEQPKEAKESGYSEELASYLPQAKGTVLNYSGFAEFGQTITLSDVVEEDNMKVFTFKGEIKDESEGEGGQKDLSLQMEYKVNEDTIVQEQKNTQRQMGQSIIVKQTVLKLPIEKGNTWSDAVTIDGKEYTAETKITDVKEDKNGKVVTTEMTIKGIKPYENDMYKEVKKFKEGKGLIEYQAPILLGKDQNPIDFSYSLYEQK